MKLLLNNDYVSTITEGLVERAPENLTYIIDEMNEKLKIDLRERNRYRTVSWPRMALIYLLRTSKQFSDIDMQKEFNYDERTTIVRNYGNVKTFIENKDSEFLKVLDNVRQAYKEVRNYIY